MAPESFHDGDVGARVFLILAAVGSPSGHRVSAVIVHFRTPARDRAAAARAVARDLAGDGDPRRGQRLRRRDRATRLATDVPGRPGRPDEPVNRGYGAACNRGVARDAAGPTCSSSTPTPYLRPGAIDALAAALDATPGAAAAGPRLSNPDGSLQPSIQRLPSPWRIFCESSGLAFLSGGRAPFAGHTADPRRTTAARARSRPSWARRSSCAARPSRQVGRLRRSLLSLRGGDGPDGSLAARGPAALLRARARRSCTREARSAGIGSSGELHASLVRYAAQAPRRRGGDARRSRSPVGRRRGSVRRRPPDAGRARPRPARALPGGALAARAP